MALRDIHFKSYYNKADVDIAKEFYLPCMSASTRYDRATGYFGSTVYLLSWSCLKEFIGNGGKIRIICSPYLSKPDQEAIDEGLMAKSSYEQKEDLFNEFKEIFGKAEISAPERILACLIALGHLEIKVAVGKQDVNRLFHDKVGVFYDGTDAVAFRGSINETFKGISDDGNFESFDAFTSWGDGNDVERLEGIQKDFEQIWNNQNAKIQAYDLPESIKEIVITHANKEFRWTEALDEVTATIDKAKLWSADKRLGGKKPRKHQLKALEEWDKRGRRGIFEHATGSGKTFSAMCAIRKELELGHPVLVLVPSIGLLNQWQKELSQMFSDMNNSYLLCGGRNSSWRTGTILSTFTRPGLHSVGGRITIAYMGAASSPEFMSKMVQSSELMVVADEVHRMGSSGNRRFFDVVSGSRLGLSATPRRYGDPEGTAAIFDYFGGLIPPPYTLKNAIDDEVLCKYFYHPHIVSLDEDEQKEWDDLSSDISREYAKYANRMPVDEILNNSGMKILLLKRARIIKNARQKVGLAKTILQAKYKEGDRWIVYCDNQDQLYAVLESLKDTGIRSYEYHSELSDTERETTLEYFEKIGGVVVSIRCLDEGIDIPNTTHALILASSQNPREFIQRRGRILRQSSNKHYAYLHDAIVIPNRFSETDKQDRIVVTELARAIQFGEWSLDRKCIYDLKEIAIDHDIDYMSLQNIGIENE